MEIPFRNLQRGSVARVAGTNSCVVAPPCHREPNRLKLTCDIDARVAYGEMNAQADARAKRQRQVLALGKQARSMLTRYAEQRMSGEAKL
jgi:hypothetical protein